jgi:polar amino acid transport system substrate-binding protein
MNKPWRKNITGLSVVFWVVSMMQFTVSAFAQDQTLRADYRQRPPEMVVDEKTGRFFGPLIDVLEAAAQQVDYRITWRKAPFQRSYKELQLGLVDIVPRVILTEERKAFVAYLGPIGCQRKDIVFLVRKGRNDLINRYEDLRKVRVGTKRDTAYFEQFNKDTSIRKVLSLDDRNMSRMFVAGRFEAMIVLDKDSIERAFKEINFNDYTYANYRHIQKIGNYYGMSKKSPNIQTYSKLNSVLQELTTPGQVNEIYKKHNVPPPVDCAQGVQ